MFMNMYLGGLGGGGLALSISLYTLSSCSVGLRMTNIPDYELSNNFYQRMLIISKIQINFVSEDVGRRL